MADYSVKYYSLVILSKVLVVLSGCCFILSDIIEAVDTVIWDMVHDVKDLYSCYAYPAAEYFEYVIESITDAWQFREMIVALDRCEE